SVVPEVRLADADDVARLQPAGPRDPAAVDEGPVRRADVLDVDAVALLLEPGVVGGGVLVAEEREVVLLDPADRHGRAVEEALGADAEDGARDDDELPVRGTAAVTRRRCCPPPAGVADDRPDDPPDEEIEEDEEDDPEGEQDLLHLRGGEGHWSSRRKTSSVEPSFTVSPCSSFARFWRRPFTSVPFVESRSVNQYAPRSCRSSACLRDMFGSGMVMSTSRPRPITTVSLSIVYRLPSLLSDTTSRAGGCSGSGSASSSTSSTAE